MRATPRAWHFLATAAGLALLLAGAYLFFVHGYMGQLLDERARNGARFGAASVMERVLDAVPVTSAALVLVAVVIGLSRRRGVATTAALAVVVAANLASQLLKHEVLTRPDNGATGVWHNSFPSGHTTVFVSAVFAVFLVSAPRARPFVAMIGAVGTVLVGAMLVGSQWHRPSDVVGGILVVAIFVFLAGAVLARVRPRRSPAPPPPHTSQRGTVVLLAVAAVVSAAAFGLAYVTADASVDGASTAMVAGLTAIAVTAGGTALLATRLFRKIA